MKREIDDDDEKGYDDGRKNKTTKVTPCVVEIKKKTNKQKQHVALLSRPVRGAPGPTPSPHKNGHQESSALPSPCGWCFAFGKPKIKDPLSII